MLDQLKFVVPALIGSICAEQDLLCRVMGDCIFGQAIDSEVGDLGVSTLLDPPEQKFTYVRYNQALDALPKELCGDAPLKTTWIICRSFPSCNESGRSMRGKMFGANICMHAMLSQRSLFRFETLVRLCRVCLSRPVRRALSLFVTFCLFPASPSLGNPAVAVVPDDAESKEDGNHVSKHSQNRDVLNLRRDVVNDQQRGRDHQSADEQPHHEPVHRRRFAPNRNKAGEVPSGACAARTGGE
jgi:hypothetical protein